MLVLRTCIIRIAILLWLSFTLNSILVAQGIILVDDNTNDTIKNCIVYDSKGRNLGYLNSNADLFQNFDLKATLYIHCLGYDTVELNIQEGGIICLKRKEFQLNTVEVYSCYNIEKVGALQGRLQKRIGTSMAVLSQHVRLFEPDTSLPGSCLITKAAVFMTKTDDRQSSTLRLRMYSTQKDTLLPGHDVLHESVLLDVSNTGDWYTTDVTDQQIYLREPLFIGWETVTVDGNLPPEYGTIVEKYPMVSYSWDVEYQFWRLFGHALMQDWKRKPNYAIQLELNCPCED